MFTGLVQDIGRIRESKGGAGGKRLVIETALDLTREKTGASICCSGCCLTVTEKGADWFSADVSPETLEKTTLGAWAAGDRVNLEPSLRLGDELGGHFVFGHVDVAAKLETIEKEGDIHRLRIELPRALRTLIAPKGSVALDGVSLTVNEVEKGRFGVAIIPHTWKNTTLGIRKPGERLNLEIDMLARYAARRLEG